MEQQLGDEQRELPEAGLLAPATAALLLLGGEGRLLGGGLGRGGGGGLVRLLVLGEAAHVVLDELVQEAVTVPHGRAAARVGAVARLLLLLRAAVGAGRLEPALGELRGEVPGGEARLEVPGEGGGVVVVVVGLVVVAVDEAAAVLGHEPGLGARLARAAAVARLRRGGRTAAEGEGEGEQGGGVGVHGDGGEIENSEVWLAGADWGGVTSPALYSTTTAPVPPTVRDTLEMQMHQACNLASAVIVIVIVLNYL